MTIFILVALAIAKWRWPNVDTNGWQFIVTVMPVAGLVFFAAWAVCHVFLVRGFLRY